MKNWGGWKKFWRNEELEFQGNSSREGGVRGFSCRGRGVVLGPSPGDAPSKIWSDVRVELCASGKNIILSVGWVKNPGDMLTEGELLTNLPSEILSRGD